MIKWGLPYEWLVLHLKVNQYSTQWEQNKGQRPHMTILLDTEKYLTKSKILS